MGANQHCSIVSPASEDSALPLSLKDLKPSALSSQTKSSESCSVIGGPEVRFCKTPETQKPLPSFAERMAALMRFQEEYLASLQVLLDSSVAHLTKDGYGLTQSDWYAQYDPVTQSLRTRQLSLISKTGEPSTELCQSWSRSGMICDGMYFRLAPLVQVTNGSASSSLLPTPCAADGERGGRGDLIAIAKDRPNKHTKRHLLPTATANDGQKRGSAYLQENRDQATFGLNLPRTIAKHLLPTPRASANESRQTKLTPSREAGTHGLSLQATVIRHYIPTPTARDYKDTPGMATEAAKPGGGMRKRDDQLPRRIYAAEGSKGPIGGMRLTLEFLCWHQGFPTNWLKPLVGALGTPLSRKSSNPSPEQSTKC